MNILHKSISVDHLRWRTSSEISIDNKSIKKSIFRHKTFAAISDVLFMAVERVHTCSFPIQLIVSFKMAETWIKFQTQ